MVIGIAAYKDSKTALLKQVMTPATGTTPSRTSLFTKDLHYFDIPYSGTHPDYADHIHFVVRLGLSRDLAPEFVLEHFGAAVSRCVSSAIREFDDKNHWKTNPDHFLDDPTKVLKEIHYSYRRLFPFQLSLENALKFSIQGEAQRHRCGRYFFEITSFKIEDLHCPKCGVKLKNSRGSFCIDCGSQIRPQPPQQSVPDKRPLIIPEAIRNQHIYVPGKTRHGKSTLFHAMAYQDIKNGAGVCVIDPKGDLVTSLLNWIPESRKDDCIYIDPNNPVPIDVLDYANPREKQTLIGELKYVITRGVSTENAPLMNSMLNDVIYTILDANENGLVPKATFLDIHDFLAFKTRRDKIMKYVKSERYLERWNEANFPTAKERQPMLTRMNDYVTSDYLTKIFGCPEPALNVARLMDEKKILLVNLGGVDEPTKIFATLLIAKIRQAAFRRNNIPESQRIPFHLYVDEFEFFQTSDFDQILSFSGGYGLRLTLANQFIGQLDSNIRNSVLGNVGTFIVFCLSPGDAHHFKHILPPPPFWAKYLPDHPADEVKIENLPKYKCLYAIAGQEPFVDESPAPPPPLNGRATFAEYIRSRTLDRYSCKSDLRPHNPDSGKPEPEGTVLPNEAEAAGSRPAGPVLRPPKQGPRTAPPKPRAKPNRHQNDKQDP